MAFVISIPIPFPIPIPMPRFQCRGLQMAVKWLSRENYLALKKARNKCTSINKKSKKNYFKEAEKCVQSGVMISKEFWKKLKTFLTNKGCFSEDQINF